MAVETVWGVQVNESAEISIPMMSLGDVIWNGSLALRVNRDVGKLALLMG